MAAVTSGRIVAAGGLVWRTEPDQRLVCLVHRPRYDDWSLPKGSVKRGEHPLTAAVREVAEETGLRGVPQLPLPATRYAVGGIPKVVEYWAMRSPGGAPPFQPNSEVDRVAWLPVPEAVRRVRYPHDAALLREWDALPPVTGVGLLVRHAEAGERGSWPGPDQDRPLSSAGEADAVALCRLLALFAPTRLVSAAPRRCQQTLAPLAADQHLPVEVDPVFDEDSADPDAATDRVSRLARAGGATVVCTQGAVLPAVLANLAGDLLFAATDRGGEETGGRYHRLATSPTTRRYRPPTGKGDGWLLSLAGSRVLAVAPLHARQVR